MPKIISENNEEKTYSLRCFHQISPMSNYLSPRTLKKNNIYIRYINRSLCRYVDSTIFLFSYDIIRRTTLVYLPIRPFCISQVVPLLARVVFSRFLFYRSRITDVDSFWLPDRDYEGHRRRAGSHHTKSSRRARIGLCRSVCLCVSGLCLSLAGSLGTEILLAVYVCRSARAKIYHSPALSGKHVLSS